MLFSRRHCVSAVSPPGTSLPIDNIRDIPHVAGSPGEDQLPPGEGCYSCNVDQGGIPLQRRLPVASSGGTSSGRSTRTLRRFKRGAPLPVS